MTTARKEDPRWLAIYGAAYVNFMATRHFVRGSHDDFIAECMRDAEAVADDEQKRRVVDLAKRSIERNQELLERLAKAEACASQSPGSPDDADDPPVTCSRERGHDGQHEGGCRGGTVGWDDSEDPTGQKESE